jgi:methyltransferase (TIGR00027 family)
MSSLEGVEHVSDTALVVAAVRAIESVRSDAMVRDPFAERVAGARGMALVQNVPLLDWMCITVGMRCHYVDELLLTALQKQDIATVVCLGAGLDTRAWRLDLPSDLRWIEVDFPGILAYKTEVLASVTPRCRIECRTLDLNDAAERRSLFLDVGEAPALMTSEGLLMYLTPSTVTALATESVAQSGIRHWLLDVASDDLMRRAHQDFQPIEKLRPAGYLRGQQVLDVVEARGWRQAARRTYTRDGWNIAGGRLNSFLGGEDFPDDRSKPEGGDPGGVYLFRK